MLFLKVRLALAYDVPLFDDFDDGSASGGAEVCAVWKIVEEEEVMEGGALERWIGRRWWAFQCGR